jgi:hypothetical protein
VFDSVRELKLYGMNGFQTALTGLVCIYLFRLEPVFGFPIVIVASLTVSYML